MTKAEYMKKLQEKLEQFNQGLQEEILEDYEQHFSEGLAMGKSEEEIIEELGNIEEMIQEFSEEDFKQEMIPAGAEQEQASEQAYSGAYRAIVADGMVADIELKESEDGRLYVHYENDDETLKQIYRFYQYERDGIFYVGVKRKEETEAAGAKRLVLFGRTILSFQNARMRGGDISLILEVPKGIPSVQVRTLSGDIEVRGLHVGELQVNTNSGDLEAENVKTDALEAGTTSGDLLLRETKSGKLDIQTSSGDVELEKVDAESCVIKTGSGDVCISALKGDTVSVGTGSGDVELHAEAEEYTVKTGSGDISIAGAAKAKAIRLGTGSGDVELGITAVPGAEIHVTTGSGDIEIYGSGVNQCGGRESSYAYGDASCKVKVSTGSGDVSVNCK